MVNSVAKSEVKIVGLDLSKTREKETEFGAKNQVKMSVNLSQNLRKNREEN
jgi:hypothetical protein